MENKSVEEQSEKGDYSYLDNEKGDYTIAFKVNTSQEEIIGFTQYKEQAKFLVKAANHFLLSGDAVEKEQSEITGDTKGLKEVSDFDGKLNTYVHAHGSETYVELQQLWFKAIEAIQNYERNHFFGNKMYIDSILETNRILGESINQVNFERSQLKERIDELEKDNRDVHEYAYGLFSDLQKAIEIMEKLIHNTPSGHVRNMLTDVNIILLSLNINK